MSTVRTRLAVGIPIAVLAALAVATPAAAFTPAGTATLTLTATTPSQEASNTTIAGECPATTTAVNVRFDWNDGAPQTASTNPTYDPVDGTFASSFPLSALTGGVPGRAVVATVDCFAAGPSIATQVTNYSLPDFGASVTAPASVTTTTALAATIDCGTATADQLNVTHRRGATTLGTATVAYTGAGSYPLPTPASLGFAAGDTATLEVECEDTGLGNVNATRLTTYAVAAPAAPPAPAAPAGPTLAESGPDEGMRAGLALLAAALITGGTGILVLRRRRSRLA